MKRISTGKYSAAPLPGQLPMFTPKSEWKPPRMADLPDPLREELISLDLETRDPGLKQLGAGFYRPDSKICGVSLSFGSGQSFYLSLRHVEDNMEEADQVLPWLASWAPQFTGTIIGANINYDLGHLMPRGVEFKRAQIHDVQIAEGIIYELYQSYSLDNIAKRRGIGSKDKRLMNEAAAAYNIADPMVAMDLMPGRYVAPYAIQDSDLCLPIRRVQLRDIEEQGLHKIWDLERALTPVLVRMRHRGVRFSHSRLDQVLAWSREEERRCLAEVKDMTGVEIPVGDTSKKSLLVRALQAVGVVLEQTPSGQAKIDKDTLKAIQHPVAVKLERAKKMDKLRSFGRGILDLADGDRLHPTFNQLRGEDEEGNAVGAAYGRMSCTNPNLQQQPSRDDFAKRWRSIYIPEEGGEWCAADYSQQEPRWLTHFAELMKLPRASEAAEKYRTDPSTDHHQMIAELTGLPRKEAKIINLGIAYGMGGAKLARDLGLPTAWWTPDREGASAVEVAGPEAKIILDTYHREAPFIRALAKATEEVAKKRGFIVTIGGRRCRFPMKANGGFDWVHKSLNRLVQGSAADQTKMAMVLADREGFALQLQVHDELDLTIYNRSEGERLREIMMAAIPGNVPFKVDLEIGPSWGEAK